jgi:hypothetical protein
MEKPQIKIFVTKTKEFRAKIKETKKTLPYEVTIGGKSWENGKGRKYEKEIKRKCKLLINTLNSNLEYFENLGNNNMNLLKEIYDGKNFSRITKSITKT